MIVCSRRDPGRGTYRLWMGSAGWRSSRRSSGTWGSATTSTPTWAAGEWLGVGMFFTLSGFLITTLMLAEQRTTGRVALGAFWSRRARRLLPALFLALALTMVLSAFHWMPPDRRLGAQVITAIFYSSNVNLSFVHGVPGRSLFQFWSLSIEEQFYLFFPLVFIGAWRLLRHKAVWLYLLGSVVAAFWVYHLRAHWRAAYFGLPRFGEILAGVAMAFVVGAPWFQASLRRLSFARLLQAIGALALITELVLLHHATLLFASYYKPAVLGTVTVSLLLVGCVVDGPATKVLSIRPLRFAGKISYGAYVYHIAIFYALSPERTGITNNLVLSIIRILAVGVVSWASYKWVEQPLRQRASPTGPRLVAAYAFPRWPWSRSRSPCRSTSFPPRTGIPHRRRTSHSSTDQQSPAAPASTSWATRRPPRPRYLACMPTSMARSGSTGWACAPRPTAPPSRQPAWPSGDARSWCPTRAPAAASSWTRS